MLSFIVGSGLLTVGKTACIQSRLATDTNGAEDN